MILHLSDHLDVPLRDRNRMLLAAGFAPRYRDHDLDDSSIAVVMDGLRGLLDAHLPYPALLLDDHWDVVDANTAVDRLLSGCAPHLLQPPINVVRLSVHPEGLAPRIRNLDSWIGYLHRQVLNRAERTQEPRQFALADEIAGHLGGLPTQDPDTGPVLTLELEVSGRTARFFSISAQLTTANDSALEGLHLETFLPADNATRQLITG